MDHEESSREWTRKGATLGHQTACREFGLTWSDIVEAIQAGKLQYRETSIYGNPVLRLLRREVEALVTKQRGGAYLKERCRTTELARIELELKRLKRRTAELERRKAELTAKAPQSPRKPAAARRAGESAARGPR